MEKVTEQFPGITPQKANGITSSVSEDITCLTPNGKDVFRPIHFSAVLSKIDEVDESRIKSSSTSDNDDDEGNKENIVNKSVQSPHVMWKAEHEIIHFEDNKQTKGKQRPKSANCIKSKSIEKERMRRSNSVKGERTEQSSTRRTLKSNSSNINKNSDSESNSESSLISVLGRPKSASSDKKNDPWYFECSWDTLYCPVRLGSVCDTGTCYSDDCYIGSRGSWIPRCESNSGKCQPRKCRSNPCLTQSKRSINPNSAFRIDKFKRSLKLLGLKVTDFGMYDSASDAGQYHRRRWKAKQVESTFSTKVVKRSISLDDLKEVVREAWLDDRLDTSHRKLLAQAAYEEWYFRKANEAYRKLSNEKMKNKVDKEKLDSELQSRKVKAEEHFQKWMAEKNKKLKLEKNLNKSSLTQFRVSKTQEEAELAFHRWKMEKDKQKKEKQKLEMKEKEREMNRERQKEEKKQMAERAFIEWKRKLEESEKNLMEAKLKKEKRKKEIERRKRENEKKTSFQMWKDMKDRELIMKRQENRKTMRIANALRFAQLEERMYEAEQAFEEWLDKLETREGGFKSKKTVS